VIISFDDSVPTAKSVAKPIMDRYGYPGVVGIVTGRTQRSGEDGQLTVEELEELRDDDWEVASHTIDHTKLTEVSNSEIRRQARESKEFIDENDLSPPDPTIVYPYGGVDDRVVDVVEEYYEYGFGGEEDPTDGIDDPMRIDRSRGHRPAEVRRQIDEAIANGSEGVAILMFHRIGTFDDPKQNDTSKDAFADLMAYIDDRSEDLDVITTSEL
jgi:peptidoglycan/xylan/chitin deacetylase (PgdA/CDA1 family)